MIYYQLEKKKTRDEFSVFIAVPTSPDGSKWERNIPPPPHVGA